MIESTGQKWDQDFIVTIFTDMAFLNYWKGDLKAMLIDYNKAHPGSPLTDEFGEIVLFPHTLKTESAIGDEPLIKWRKS
jgi:hypothetical protein